MTSLGVVISGDGVGDDVALFGERKEVAYLDALEKGDEPMGCIVVDGGEFIVVSRGSIVEQGQEGVANAACRIGVLDSLVTDALESLSDFVDVFIFCHIFYFDAKIGMMRTI